MVRFLALPLVPLVVAVAALTASLARAEAPTHVVAKGQTLARIAKRYHTSVEALLEVNALKPRQRLQPGLVLVIPEKGNEAEAARKALALRRADDGDPGARKGGGKAKGADRAAEARKGSKSPGDGERSDRQDGGYARRPKRPGFVRMVRGTEHFEAQLLGRHGRLNSSALAGLGRILRHYPSGANIPIDPRLASLLGLVSDHFGGRTFHVVSGFRPYSPAQYTPHSNHNAGRAMDFLIEGVPNTAVRDFCRTFRNAGVGYYPNSTFVHLDARVGRTFWIDYSRAGEPPRYDTPSPPADADETAGEVDSRASANGLEPPPSGSDKTLLAPVEAPEKIQQNADRADSTRGNKENQGQTKPSP